jgi:sensor histidine kinase YesM
VDDEIKEVKRKIADVEAALAPGGQKTGYLQDFSKDELKTTLARLQKKENKLQEKENKLQEKENTLLTIQKLQLEHEAGQAGAIPR